MYHILAAYLEPIMVLFRPRIPLYRSTPMDELESLRSTFNLAIDALQDELKKNQLPSLSTSALEPHPIDRADYDCPPRLYEARKLALATMGQIRNLIQRPYERVSDQSGAGLQVSGLDILIKTGIVEKLNKAPDPSVGLSVKTLQKDLDIDSNKLTTVMRYMAAQGWLRETSEGVFALTRLALELREGQLGWKWAMYPCLTKVAASTLDQIAHKDRGYRYSRSPNQAAFQLAYDTDKTVFGYMKEHPDQLKLFANAIQAIGDAYQTSIEKDFPWAKYDSYKFVDVGGGKGNLSIMLVKKLPKAQFVIQDLEEVVKFAQTNIKDKVPEPCQQSRITAITHNFFEPQPVVGPNHVYLLRYILHDWPDDDCIRILRSIVDVADPSSKILIVEVVAEPCSTSSEEPSNGIKLDDLKDAVEYTPISPPAYIPKNFGTFANTSLSLGYHMLGLLNSLERTEVEWETMLAKANIKIDKIHPLRGMLSVIECSIIKQ